MNVYNKPWLWMKGDMGIGIFKSITIDCRSKFIKNELGKRVPVI